MELRDMTISGMPTPLLAIGEEKRGQDAEMTALMTWPVIMLPKQQMQNGERFLWI
jgi:hypothetical protein